MGNIGSQVPFDDAYKKPRDTFANVAAAAATIGNTESIVADIAGKNTVVRKDGLGNVTSEVLTNAADA